MFKKLIDTLINYIETKLEIYKLQAKEEASKIIAFIVLILIFLMLLLLFLLFISLFVGEIINKALSNDYVGYLIVSGFYIIGGLLLYLFRKKIQDKITNAMFTEEEEN